MTQTSRLSLFLALLVAAALSACVAEPGPGSPEPEVFTVDRLDEPEDDRNLTAGQKQTARSLSRQLTKTHGLRPRRYNGLLNGQTAAGDRSIAEQCFVELLPQVVNYVNGRLAARNYDERVDEYDIAVNIIAEGGFNVLRNDQTTGLSSFGSVGADTLVTNYRALKPYLHPSVRTVVEGGQDQSATNNEKGQQVVDVGSLDLEVAMYANAGMFAYARALAARDMRRPQTLRRWCQTRKPKKKTPHPDIESTNLASLPRWQQHFWTTLYFNVGPGQGRTFLCEHWLPWAGQRYTGSQSTSSGQNNAVRRTSSYRYMSGTATPNIRSYCEAKNGAPCTCDRCSFVSECAACAAAAGCGYCSNEGRCASSGDGCVSFITDAAVCNAGTPPGGCSSDGALCSSDADCCGTGGVPGSCIAGSCATCGPGDVGLSEPCGSAGVSCCGVAVCSALESVSELKCCLGDGFGCDFNTDCCGAMQCEMGACACQTEGEVCLTGRECCGALFCNEGRCSSS
ncbi:MAG: hypothetical protein AAGF12_05080 [Myxococcota bacterium]